MYFSGIIRLRFSGYKIPAGLPIKFILFRILKELTAVQKASATSPIIPSCLTLIVAFTFSGIVSAQQSIESNIRPVAEVCLAGQSCVGTVRGGASNTQGSVAPASVAAPVAAAVAPAPSEVATSEPAAFDAAQAYQMSCFACHGTGAAGAPKLGDADAWAARLEKGMDSVMVNATNGINAMPPKGMCMTCTDENLRALVDYMISQ